MAARDTTRSTEGTGSRSHQTAGRLSTETKSAFKTSEFVAYLVVLLGILIAGNSIEKEEGGPDLFPADEVWLYATILTVGYMIARGLAKSGSRDPFWGERGDRNADH